MNPEDLEQHWQQKSQDVSHAIAQWRQAHPTATLAEIEAAVDIQMNQLRARMIEEVALASPLEHASSSSQTCPACGLPMQARGKRSRRLQTQGNQSITLQRRYQSCPHCGYSFFPPR